MGVSHPQAILRAVLERSDLTPSERLEMQEAMFYGVLEVALESALESVRQEMGRDA